MACRVAVIEVPHCADKKCIAFRRSCNAFIEEIMIPLEIKECGWIIAEVAL